MSLYKKTMIFVVVLILIFYGGYRLGVVYGTKWATEILIDIGKFQVADRAAAGINEIQKIKSHLQENKVALCQAKSLVMRQAEDLASCRRSPGCAKDFSGPFYVQAEKYVLEFEKITCP